MQSIDRAMTVAKVLVATENGLSITELSNRCELPLSTLHRLLKAMIKQGMIQQDKRTKSYSLGTVWLEYGLRVYDTMDYVSKIRPELERLMRDVDESVYLSKSLGLEALIIERIDSENNPIRIYDQLGLRIPMHIGAANKAMLAHMPTAQTNEILNALLAKEKIPEMVARLKEIKKQGYATSHGERTEDTSSIAVAILNRYEEVVGAISIGLVSFNLTDSRIDFLAEKAIETGERVSRAFGYHG